MWQPAELPVLVISRPNEDAGPMLGKADGFHVIVCFTVPHGHGIKIMNQISLP
jgi:hypothetical protein